MTLLSAANLCVSRQGRDVLQGVSLSVAPGEFIGLIGPNGAGKTTLMRALLGLLPCTGTNSLAALPEAARARHAAWMPQAREIAWPVTVETVVRLGRIPHLSAMQTLRPEDQQAVDAALSEMDLGAMRHRDATQLSGGEQARVLIARALAQQTPLLLADEPVAGLDPAHQIATMKSFARLAERGHSALVSLHDLGLAVRHCSRLILLDQGRLVADGRPEEVLTSDRLAHVFGVSAQLTETKDGILFQLLDVIS